MTYLPTRRALAIFFVSRLWLAAQTNIPSSGEPEVFGVFLRAHNVLVQEIAKRKLTDPESAQSLEKSAAALLRLNMTDFEVLSKLSSSMQAESTALDAEASAYTRNGTRPHPDMKALARFETRRKQILTSVVRRLEAGISKQGWQSLNEYVDREFRSNVRFGRPVAPGQPPNTK